MHFSIGVGVSFLCVAVLLFLPVQGQLRPSNPDAPQSFHACCMQVSRARIGETVKACFRQKEQAFGNCKIRAYIFTTVSGRQFCVDPRASWLSKRLRMLQRKGVSCTNL